MTLIIGIRCSDGIVMASDSAGSLGTGIQFTIGQQQVTKIVPIEGSILYSSTGGLGMAQLLIEKIRGQWNPTFFANARAPEAMHKIGTTIAEIVRVYASNGQALQQIGCLQRELRSQFGQPLRRDACRKLLSHPFYGAVCVHDRFESPDLGPFD